MIHITHDGVFDIATGKHRKDTTWRNKEMLWSTFVERVSEPHRTAETYKEYVNAKPDRQAEIKDVGGFVGGFVQGGRRLSRSILHRQLVTLDIDFGSLDFWSDFTMLYGCAACLYSTHKHSADKPRMRLVIPLDRAVMVDEYQAISRKIAEHLNIEVFDPTTFQPERLMYWASASSDGDWLFEYQDGDWLSTDEVLNSYADWKDSSSWAVSSKVDKIVQNGIAKQGDPLEKAGTVGAFCRSYTIHEAIEAFLSDEYESCDVENRYTYKHGSTAAGLVIYDDKFAYSHHGTDPTSGKLCNAFDLVRIHKFGIKDSEAADKTPITKMPSYLAMLDLANGDKNVRKLMLKERLDACNWEFEEYIEADNQDEEIDDSWQENLDTDRKGNVNSTISNICLIFENDRYFKGKIKYDEFEKCQVAVKHLPWRKVGWNNRRLTDNDDSNIRHYLEQAYGISHLSKTNDAMRVWAQRCSFHPVREYLESLSWDGAHRLDSLLIDYQGAQDSEYTRVVTRKSLVAAVARIFQPGCKYDTVLTLVGDQSKKKSSLLAKLGKQWFSDSFSFNTLSKNETKACEQIQGVWLVEIAELSGLAKAEIETVKHFITKTEDRFRVAYGVRTENFPRQCVFFATTNKWDFLRDPTGNRRYWPVEINKTAPTKDVFKDLTDSEINQIWAEAVHYYRKGEKLYLDERMSQIAAVVQRIHTEEHPWTSLVQNYLERLFPTNYGKMDLFERGVWLRENSTEVDENSTLGDLTLTGTQTKTRTCLPELWHEAIGKKEAIDERSANILRNIMAGLDGWIEEKNPLRYSIYGLQRRGYIFNGKTEKSSEKSVTNGCNTSKNDVTDVTLM